MNSKIAGICDLKYEGAHKFLFGDDFSQTMSRAEQKKKVTDTVAKAQQQDFRWGKKYKKPPGQNQGKNTSTNKSSNNQNYNKDSNNYNYSRSSSKTQYNKKGGKRGYWKSRTW